VGFELFPHLKWVILGCVGLELGIVGGSHSSLKDSRRLGLTTFERFEFGWSNRRWLIFRVKQI
jgi:hypothetical protein